MLTLDAVNAFYGKSHILHDVSLHVQRGELVSILGRNGAGKTTTLKSIAGAVVPRTGSVRLDGEELVAVPTHRIARLGVALVPEHRGIFTLLSVEENLRIAVRRGSRWQIDDVYAMFPRLKERRRNPGSALSGGEQQMLAIGRALLTGPRLLLLDEPTEGLAPVIVDELTEMIAALKRSGLTIVLVEQNLAVCMAVADRHYIVEEGHVVYAASNAEFEGADDVRDRYLGVRTAVAELA